MAQKIAIKRKVIQIGNSIGITVDRTFLKEAGLSPGDSVEIRLSKPKGTLTVKKVKTKPPSRRSQTSPKRNTTITENLIHSRNPYYYIYI